MLNLHLKIISKALSLWETKKSPTLPSQEAACYVQNRHIGESVRSISDIIEIAKIKKIGFLITMDIEKAFDFFGS